MPPGPSSFPRRDLYGQKFIDREDFALYRRGKSDRMVRSDAVNRPRGLCPPRTHTAHNTEEGMIDTHAAHRRQAPADLPSLPHPRQPDLLGGDQGRQRQSHLQGHLPPGRRQGQVIHRSADQHLRLPPAGAGDGEHRQGDGAHPGQVPGPGGAALPPHGGPEELRLRRGRLLAAVQLRAVGDLQHHGESVSDPQRRGGLRRLSDPAGGF